MAKRKAKIPLEPTRFDFETFSPFSSSHEASLTQKEPSSFNDFVRVRRWRVIAELIDEPIEVIAERIRKLWRECEDINHHSQILSAAAIVGIDLDSKELGIDRKKKVPS